MKSFYFVFLSLVSLSSAFAAVGGASARGGVPPTAFRASIDPTQIDEQTLKEVFNKLGELLQQNEESIGKAVDKMMDVLAPQMPPPPPPPRGYRPQSSSMMAGRPSYPPQQNMMYPPRHLLEEERMNDRGMDRDRYDDHCDDHFDFLDF